MFSYRHGFHAGAHSDVFKHTVLIAILKYMTQKDAGLTIVDTHAGAGLYRLDGDFAEKSGEAADGIFKLLRAFAPADGSGATPIGTPVEALEDYLHLIASFNSDGRLKVYPGSPFVVHSLLRKEARDRLRLFELHPADAKALSANVEQLGAGRQIAVARQDGFESLKALLPPPNRRGLVLIDPSYEIKSDYAKVSACLQDSLKRFPTGTYAVWYPVIPRPEAHEMPRRLKTLATQAGKPWLQASLAIGQAEDRKIAGEPDKRPGLTASGMFVVNPPHTLKATLQETLPQLLAAMQRGTGKGYTLDAGT